ncbi:hypothetical protein AKJ45_03140 [candidate division MSBL1 archaeon SCGC-AAA261F19]|uniref:Uncharacterized protein n=1 Tax=candidate division MSBL1 archaeon SCGC-AAA261F19 TaxID=1698275 RepID=A0A133V912_9EURY|nr:hypothetical protein AKJ45_03140 [candidate division MSBL1 archaeon SCGC-AAA261F19]
MHNKSASPPPSPEGLISSGKVVLIKGHREQLSGLKTPLLEASEAGKGGEGMPGRRVHPWSPWRLTGGLGPHKGASCKHTSQSPETIGVESSGTIAPTERGPAEAICWEPRPQFLVVARPPEKW